MTVRRIVEKKMTCILGAFGLLPFVCVLMDAEGQSDVVGTWFTEQRFEIPEVAHVILKVFDVLGREVATLVSGEQEAGTHRVEWNAAGLPSGVYLYRLEANGFTEARKLLLIR